MKYSSLAGMAFVIAASVAYVAHTVFGFSPRAIRTDALEMAGCLVLFLGAGFLAQRHDRQ
jgi:hypothetical protein